MRHLAPPLDAPPLYCTVKASLALSPKEFLFIKALLYDASVFGVADYGVHVLASFARFLLASGLADLEIKRGGARGP